MKKEMTVSEAGRKGGNKTKEKYGKDFYRKIGKAGGDETKALHGHEFYEAIGKKGGAEVKRLIAAGKEADKDA